MKTPPLSLLNSIGFTNIAQKLLYATSLLKAATLNSPPVVVVPAVVGVAGKPEVLAQTAKPARAATPSVLGVNNTTGFAFGEIYLNSPAYPIGTAIPAIPAKPASAAVTGSREIVAVIAKPAISSPAIVAIPGWEDAVRLTFANGVFTLRVYLPYAGSATLAGSPVIKLLEITPPALQPSIWLDTLASATPEVIASEPPTLEEYLYQYALAAVAMGGVDCQVNNDYFIFNGKSIPCKRIDAIINLPGWVYGIASLQLNKAQFN